MKPPSNQILWALGGVGLLVLATARAGIQMGSPAPKLNPSDPPDNPPDASPTPPGSPPPGKTSCGYPAQLPVQAPPKTTAELVARVKAIILKENPAAESNARSTKQFGGYTAKAPFVDTLADALVRSAKLYRLPVDLLVAHCRVESTFNYWLSDAYIRSQADGVTKGCPRPWPTRKNSEGKSYLIGKAIGPLQIKTFTASDRGFCFVKWLPENNPAGQGCNFSVFGVCVSKPDPKDPRFGLSSDARVLMAVQAGAAHLRWTRDQLSAAGYKEWCHASEAYYTGVGAYKSGVRNSAYVRAVSEAANRFSELRLS